MGSGVGAVEGLVTEIIITFALVYTVYATAVDPKRGPLGTVAPIAIGFIVAANILGAGPFSGGSMNPARSFGPAVASRAATLPACGSTGWALLLVAVWLGSSTPASYVYLFSDHSPLPQ